MNCATTNEPQRGYVYAIDESQRGREDLGDQPEHDMAAGESGYVSTTAPNHLQGDSLEEVGYRGMAAATGRAGCRLITER